MKLFNNAAVYVISYLVLMVPTYILPYFGSNSALIGAASAAVGLGSYPLFWLHAMFLFALCVIAWARGGYVKKNWLAVLPGLATFFDLMPGFSWIPLLPTGLHVAAIITGAVSKPMSQGESPVPSAPLLRDAKLWTLAVGCGILFVLFLSSVHRIEDRSNKTMADLAKGVPLYRAGKDDEPRRATPPAAPQAAPAAPAQSERPQPTTVLTPQWVGTWRSQDGNKTITVSEAKIDVQDVRKSEGGQPERIRYEHSWLDKSEAEAEEGRFGYSRKETSPAEIANRLEAAILQYEKDPNDFSISNPTASRHAVAAISPGRYKVVWSYAGGDCGIWEYIVGGDRMLEVSDCKYHFTVQLLNRVR